MKPRIHHALVCISVATAAIVAPAAPVLAGTSPGAPAPAASAAAESAASSVPQGTMGVEVAVRSDLKRWSVHVTDRNADWRVLLQPGESTYFKGNRSGIDDVELKTLSNGGTHEVDFSNPTIGLPNASVDGALNYFSVGEEDTWNAGKHKFWIKRHGDRDGHKQFELRISARWYEE